MATIKKQLTLTFKQPNIAESYGPYTSISAAHTALSEDQLNVVGMTIGIQTGNTIEEYWYQGGTTEAHLVKKETDTTQLEQTVDGINENYLKAGQSSGSSSVDFDAFADTIHNNAQILSSTQKQQARQNIDAQKTLESGVNIKTINGESLIGSGNITIDYSELSNLPQINSITLSGNKSASALGLATAAQGAKADTAVQQVTVGTTTTGAAGSNASVTNSGTSTAPVLDFTIPRGADGADAVNPFKGWYNAVVTGEAGSLVITSETQNLPANPIVGDYAYVKTYNISGDAPSQTETPVVKIYECNTAGTWSNSGRTADTSNVQTFASGEEVNEVHIVDDLTTGGDDDVLSAEQGKVLNQFVNSKEFLLSRNENNLFAQNYSNFTSNKSINNSGVVIDNANANAIVSDFINVNPNNIYLYVGTTINGTSPNVACYDENDNYIYGFKYSYSSSPTPKYIVLPQNTKKVRIAYYAAYTRIFFEYSSSLNFAFQDYLEIRKNLDNRGIPSNVVDISNSVSWNDSKKINVLTGAIEDYTPTNNLQKVSDEIEINPNSVYIYYGFTIVVGLVNYALYDSNHNFISSGRQVGSYKNKHIIYPPVNAKYIRVSYFNRNYDDFLKEISFSIDMQNAESIKVNALKNDYTIEYIFNSKDKNTYSGLISGKRLTTTGIVDVTNQLFKITPYITIDKSKIYHYKGETTNDNSYRHILSFDENDNVVDALWFKAEDDFDIKFSEKAVKFVAGFYNPSPAYDLYPQYWQYLSSVTINNIVDNFKPIKRVDESIEVLTRINHWKGKIMCAFGASGTYGATDISFPVEVGKILDCTVRNFAKYNQATRYYDTAMDEQGVPTRAGLSTTLAEYEALGSTAYTANCWENAFTTDLDLVIFGEGDSNCPGGDELIDLIQLPTQNNKHYTYSNGDTLAQHRDSYIGALVYLLDKLWGINPACRVVFTNDYLYISDYSHISGLRNRTKALCEKLCLPNIQIWQKLGWSWYNQHIYMSHTSNPDDTVHPNELGTKKVAQIYANELLLIS